MSSPLSRRQVLGAIAATGAIATLAPGSASAASDGELHEVEIRNFKFIPDTLEVRPGDRIRWTNRDRAPHNATANDKSWRTRNLRLNKKADVIVTADMVPEYFCSIHPQMRAKLVILTG